MRVWSVSELDGVIRSLEPLVGLRLQEVTGGDSDFALGFYSSEGLLWLWVDLNAVVPSLLPWTSLPLSFKAVKSPLLLFLKAHFVGRTLRSVQSNLEVDRGVTLEFGAKEDSLLLKALLIPHRRNLVATAPGKHGAKTVAWQKPNPPVESVERSASAATLRNLETLRSEWLEYRGESKGKKGLRPASDPRKPIEKDLAKKRAALVKVREELQRKLDQPWRKVGDWLKSEQSLQVPREWEPFVDRKRKLSWNIENAYGKAREMAAKILGTEKRIGILESEIANLEERLAGPIRVLEKEAKPLAQPLAAAEAHGRTLRLNAEVTVVAGKSAVDNMKILRRARAWDLWIHMRDFPSSHAIVFRNKGTKVTDSELQQVAQWFVRLQFASKVAQHLGEKFELIVAECRHVRPIKGDKIGRVTYRDERNLICQLT